MQKSTDEIAKITEKMEDEDDLIASMKQQAKRISEMMENAKVQDDLESKL